MPVGRELGDDGAARQLDEPLDASPSKPGTGAYEPMPPVFGPAVAVLRIA